MQTYWSKNRTAQTEYPSLSGDVTADVAVIGGGLAGLLCAEELKHRGKKVCVLEADRVGGGETAGSSAMVTFAHDLIYQQLVKKHGEPVAAAYYRHAAYGLEKIRSLAQTLNCGYRACDFVFFATTEKGASQLEKESAVYERLGIGGMEPTQTELPFAVTAAFRIKEQFCLNPWLFAQNLAARLNERGVQIYENTRAIEKPRDGALKLGSGTVRAGSFIVATHFPYFDFPGLYFAKMYQSRSHNVVFDGELSDMYESAEEDGYEFRPMDDGAMCGGGAVRTGKYKYNSFYQKVEAYVRGGYGEETAFTGRFSAQDCMTFDTLPFAGALGVGLYVVTGFNKWGFTTSAACARILADAIEGKETENIFSPDRLYLLKTPLKTLRHLGTAAAEYVNLLLSPDAKKLSRIQCGQGAVIRHRGKRLGVYRTEEGELKAISAVCPHLGCPLKWNKDERTWDCPCHGSRFDTDGQIISSPAARRAGKSSVHENSGNGVRKD